MCEARVMWRLWRKTEHFDVANRCSGKLHRVSAERHSPMLEATLLPFDLPSVRRKKRIVSSRTMAAVTTASVSFALYALVVRLCHWRRLLHETHDTHDP